MDADWPSNPAELVELGFRRDATAHYQKSGVILAVHATQFQDATGAYGLFAQQAKDNLRLQYDNHGTHFTRFRNGDTVVVAQVDGALPPHLLDDLNILAKQLPIPTGSKAQLPELPDYLPKSGLDIESICYALGPAGFAITPSPLVSKLDFNTGAEVVVAKYGSGVLTLIEYPTPQMAAAQLKVLSAQLNLQPQRSLPDGLVGGNDEVMWRTGPLLGLTSSMPQAQAIKLASEVHYESEVTWNHTEGYVSDAWRAAHLYLGIFALAGILCAASVILGLFFGGARALTRVMRGKSASAVEDTEFISLDLGHGGDYKPGPKN